MKNKWFIAAGVGTFGLFCLVFSHLLFGSHESFPNLKNADYIGWIPGKLIASSDERVYFGIDAGAEAGTLQARLFRSGWTAKVIIVSDDAAGNGQPLLLTGPEAVLRFGGHQDANNAYSGTVVNLSSGSEAKWQMYHNEVPAERAQNTRFIAQLLSEKAEQDNLQLQIDANQTSSQKAVAEQKRLTNILSEGQTLEQRAQSRFSEKQSEIDNLKNQIEANQKSLARLQSALDISRSVTQQGRISTLGRESMAREFRAIDNKLQIDSHKNDAALLADLSHAREALALKEELIRYGVSFEEPNLQ